MKQPLEYEQGDADRVLCKLCKALFGLSQARKQWCFGIDTFLFGKPGMDLNLADEGVSMRRCPDGTMFLIALYVGDLFIECINDLLMRCTKEKFIWRPSKRYVCLSDKSYWELRYTASEKQDISLYLNPNMHQKSFLDSWLTLLAWPMLQWTLDKYLRLRLK